ncbi:MAG: MFS transporter [Verrucomicrobiota bacterium]
MPSPVASTERQPRLWPIATVMATSVFATTFVQTQCLGQQPINALLMDRMKLNSDTAATFVTLSVLPWTFKAVAGLLVDRVALLGSHRRSYLLLSALLAIAMWLLMALESTNYNLLLACAIFMNAALVLGSTAANGLLVEAGQRTGASGRLSSLRQFAYTLASVIAAPAGGYLAGRALGWTSAVAILPLASLFCASWFLLQEVSMARRNSDFADVIWEKIRPLPRRADFLAGLAILLLAFYYFDRFLLGLQLLSTAFCLWILNKMVALHQRTGPRWQLYLPAALVCFIQAVPTFRSTCFYEYQTKTLEYTNVQIGWLSLAGYGVALLSSGVYAWGCRKISLRSSLYAAIGLTSLSALPYLCYPHYSPASPWMAQALVIESVGTFLQYLAYVPLFDLAIRSTPKGGEALGFAVLISIWNIGLMLGGKVGPMLYEGAFHQHMNHLVWLNAGLTLAGALLVYLLPGALVDNPEGKPSPINSAA